MGKRKRERREKESSSSLEKSSDDAKVATADGVCVRKDPDDCASAIPTAWSEDSIQNATKVQLNPSLDVSAIGLQLALGTMEALEKKSNKKCKDSTTRIQIKPSPIQLNLWPLLLDSLQSPSEKCNNILGIAPTGSGKTLSYCLPVVSKCIQKVFSPAASGKSLVHGLVLCPTRELAMQVSNEMKTVIKVANRMLKKAANALESVELKVESFAIYGGVDIQSQMDSLGVSNYTTASCKASKERISRIVAATPGRLLDILKQLSEMEQPPTIFDDVAIMIFDEADRMALNAEMSTQIDQILNLLQAQNKNGFIRCLVSATLPKKAEEAIDRWVSCPRIVVKIDSVNVGDNEQVKDGTNSNTEASGSTKINAEESENGNTNTKQKHQLLANLDLATIPSNLVQTLHVCANHKKPKKLVTTLKRIYQNGSRSSGNKLCIVFFAQIKTLKFISTLLRKEGKLLAFDATLVHIRS
jgi:superfamily II DNA/RNA helicase